MSCPHGCIFDGDRLTGDCRIPWAPDCALKRPRVLFVGQNPGTNRGRGTTISRLNAWLGSMGLDSVSFVNCGHYPGPRPTYNLSFLRRASQGYEKVVALGNEASKCLSLLTINHFKMPHPSGRNRLLNDPVFVSRMISSCHDYIHGGKHDDALRLLAAGPLLHED